MSKMDDLSGLGLGGVGAVDQLGNYKTNGLTPYSLICTINDRCATNALVPICLSNHSFGTLICGQSGCLSNA